MRVRGLTVSGTGGRAPARSPSPARRVAPAYTVAPARTLIAGVGHRFWRDHSVGPEWGDRLAELDWPDGVVVDDYSFGALAMVQRLEDERYDRAIFIACEERGRPAASVHVYPYTYDPSRLTDQRVHDHLFEAVAGVLAIDLLLVAGGHFGALPAETWVIEVEPHNTSWGDGISREVEAVYPDVLERVRDLVAGEGPDVRAGAGSAGRDVAPRGSKGPYRS